MHVGNVRILKCLLLNVVKTLDYLGFDIFLHLPYFQNILEYGAVMDVKNFCPD